jgi:hypothetical protein
MADLDPRFASLAALRQSRETPIVGCSPRAHRGSAKKALGEGARAVQKGVEFN